jgi:hypothetical protein
MNVDGYIQIYTILLKVVVRWLVIEQIGLTSWARVLVIVEESTMKSVCRDAFLQRSSSLVGIVHRKTSEGT